MASIADLQVDCLEAINTTASNVISRVVIPDSYPELVGQGQNARTISVNGTVTAATDAEAQILKSQLIQIFGNDSEVVYLNFDRNQGTYNGFYILESSTVGVSVTPNNYPFSFSAVRLKPGSIGTYWGAYGIEHEFSVTKLSIVGLPSGTTYTTGVDLTELTTEGGPAYIRKNNLSNTGVYKFPFLTEPSPDFYIGQCVVIDDYTGVIPARVYGAVHLLTGTVIAINNGLVMWQIDVSDPASGIMSLHAYDGTSWVEICSQIVFEMNSQIGKITQLSLESISMNKAVWSVDVCDDTGLFATARFTLRKGMHSFKVDITTNTGVTITDIQMQTVSGQTITTVFNEVAVNPPATGCPFDVNSNYGGANLDTDGNTMGFAYTKLQAGNSYPASSLATVLKWGRTITENQNHTIGLWVVAGANPYPLVQPFVKIGRGFLGDANLNYVFD
ncbi:MAG: hypothetical protein GY928_34015 [Colwellia sp.]|nr:hypothetical protein [Colwellia sp.]